MVFYSICSHAQADTLDYFSLSFEELVNVKIISASKKSENLFDAPLSASVLGRDEIQRSGATSIMEALRLIPGVIVRQLTNGNYDIHIRGLDNIPPNTLKLSSISTTTLVMINNRPVYNYLQGGIFWETLPVDLNDIEKIEVIRGPSSTLYGPNAVSGVINIITHKVEKKGLNVNADIQHGSMNTSIANGSVGYRFNKKLSAILSGNFQLRERDTQYFDGLKQRWYDTIDSLSLSGPSDYFPHPERSMRKYGINTFVQYKPKDKMEFNFSSGFQDSEVQTSNFDVVANINTFVSQTHYFDLRASTFGLTSHISFNSGYQWPIVGYRGGSFDFSATDASFEYELKIKNLSLKPEVSYRSAMYDDTKLWDASKKEGILNGRRYMETYGATIRGEYSFWKERIRLTGGLRFDKFNYPGKWFMSYQAAPSIKVNKNNLFRLVYSKAFRSPFIYDTYQDIQSLFPLITAPEMYVQWNFTGNKNLNLLSSTMFEIGYRGRLTSNLSIDIEGYSTKTENYSGLISYETSETPENFPTIARVNLQVRNLPLWVQQMGSTISMILVVKKFQFRPFLTFQETTIHDYSIWNNTNDIAPSPLNMNPASDNINSGTGTKIDHKFTPSVYGGVFANYQWNKVNLNVSGYYMSRHAFYHSGNLQLADGSGIGHIKEKAIINAKASYTPVKYLSLFLNAKNILGNESREHYQTDITPAMILGGFSMKF